MPAIEGSPYGEPQREASRWRCRIPVEADCVLGGGYIVLQLLVEELTGLRPFTAFSLTQILETPGATASSFRRQRTTATASPHRAGGDRIPNFSFAE